MAPDTAGGMQSDAGRQEVLCRPDEILRHYAVFDDFLRVIDIVDKAIEGLDALLQPALDVSPIGGLDEARNDIEREDAFGPGRLAIDVEGDTQMQQGLFRRSLALQDLAFWQC